MNPTPEIGDNIRYILFDGPQAGQPRLAFVTFVHPTGKVSLTCLPAADDRIGVTLTASQAAYSETKEPGTWHWPSAAQH